MELLPGISIPVSIQRSTAPDDIAWCASQMASSEPWITLRRSYEDSVKLLSDPISELYLLQHEQQRGGFIMVKMKGSFTGYIQTILLCEQLRGRGIGEAAIGYIEERIFRETPNVFICVSSFNNRARKLYQRLGFEPVGLLKDYVITGHDELLMRKTRGSLHDFKTEKPANA